MGQGCVSGRFGLTDSGSIWAHDIPLQHKGALAILRLIAAAVVTVLCMQVSAHASGPAHTALPRVGDYLDTRYIQALQKTGSPWKAAAEDTRLGWPQDISVQPAAGGRLVALNYGWHDGRLLVVVQRNGEMHRELAWTKPPGVALRIAAGDTLCLASATAPQAHCYVYVGDAVRYVAGSVLAGAYRDRQGQEYRFSADGHAHFPGFDFRYALMLEQANDPYDFFQIDGGHFMAFRRDGDRITLFPVGPARHAGYGMPDFSHPLAVLTSKNARRVVASN